jgi:hypothetical protein
VALGWGLWEGPARFYFWDLIFPEPTLFSAGCSENIVPLDFHGKWHNITEDNELELVRLRIDEAPAHLLGGRFATVAAYRAYAVAFLAPPLEWKLAAAMKNGLIKASAGR